MELLRSRRKSMRFWKLWHCTLLASMWPILPPCLAFFYGVNFLVKAMANLELYEIHQSYFYVFVFFQFSFSLGKLLILIIGIFEECTFVVFVSFIFMRYVLLSLSLCNVSRAAKSGLKPWFVRFQSPSCLP